jgi:hypothetical protein
MSQQKAEKEYFMKLGRLYSCEGRNFGLCFSVVDGNKGSGTCLADSFFYSNLLPANSYELYIYIY